MRILFGPNRSIRRSPLGLMKRSYLGGFLVKLGPTKVTLVTIRFQAFFFRFPECSTLNISSSATGRTCVQLPHQSSATS